MPKPRGNLDKPSVPKAAAAVPFSHPAERVATAAGGQKSLTVKLDATDYWALRDFCSQQERQTGKRVTHQDVMVSALRELLAKTA